MTTISPKHVVLEKNVGQTPLDVILEYKKNKPEYSNFKMAYAGRLDPMASGALLVLIGEECKQQKKYHSLDKEYIFEVLFGVHSDSGDVLGIVKWSTPPQLSTANVVGTLRALKGPLTLPYPTFSAKTVHGKPLHTWTLENRLSEIEVPTKHSTIYDITLLDLRSEPKELILRNVRTKIASIPQVTDARKALGADFRRKDVYTSWDNVELECTYTNLQIATIRCRCSSGTYMRSLAEVIAKKLNTVGIAYSIHRTIIGTYQPIPIIGGMWKKRF